jgi:hypothetical protein
LKPLIRANFSYVHFKYVNDAVGIIGIPPELAVSPPGRYEDWSVLWHEIAGYAIALHREKDSDELVEWAGALSKIIPGGRDRYHELYLDSIAKTLVSRQPEWLSIDAETIRKYYKPGEEPKWTADWLAEFLEDLFLVRVFVPEKQQAESNEMITDEEKPAPIWALINALSKSYSDFTIGDQSHPPPNLRVLVALAYLDHSFDKGKFATAVEQLALQDDPYQLTKASQDLALTIARFCDEKVDQLFDKVSETELRLARLALGLPQSAVPEKIFKEMEAVAASTSPAALERREQFITTKIPEQTKLEDLLKLQFIDVDPGRFGPPYLYNP